MYYAINPLAINSLLEPSLVGTSFVWHIHLIIFDGEMVNKAAG